MEYVDMTKDFQNLNFTSEPISIQSEEEMLLLGDVGDLELYNKIKDQMILISPENAEAHFDKNTSDNFISYYNGTNYTYYTSLMKLIFNNEEYFNSLIKVLEDTSLNYVSIGKLENHDKKILSSLPKSIFSKICKQLSDNGFIDIEKSKLDKVIQLTSKNRLNSDDFDKYKKFSIDNKIYTIETKDLVNFFKNSGISTMFDIRNLSEKYNVSNEEMAYILSTFENEYKIISKYEFSPILEDTFNRINTGKLFDCTYINKVLTTVDDNLEKTTLNPILVNYVMKDIPKHYDLLQKSIYVYLKLCKTLTYDPDFYVHEQKGEVAKKHEDISRLADITPKNNQIVCYEFKQIYGKFLNILGINYENNELYKKYGGQHSSLIYRVGKYVISADSVTSILGSDLFNVKINEEINGLNLMYTKNSDNIMEFENITDEVYCDLQELNNKNETIFADLLLSYRSLSDKFELSVEDKLSIVEKKVKKSTLVCIDKLNLLKDTIKTVCDSKDIKICIVKKKVDESKLKPVLIVSAKNNENEFSYYEYDEAVKSFKVISQNKMQSLFNNETYLYFKNDHKLDGIDLNSDNQLEIVDEEDRYLSNVENQELKPKKSNLPMKQLLDLITK